MSTKQKEYEDAARKAGAEVRHLIDAATGEISEIAEGLEQKITDKPVKASLVVLAAGVVLGLLLGRRA